MEAKKCDRCGKLYEYTPVEMHSERYDASDSVILRRCCMDGVERGAQEWDLCPYCRNAFLNWIKAGGVVETAPAEAEEAEAQRVNVGEYWQHIDGGEIVKITSVSTEGNEVWHRGVSSKRDYYNSIDYFLKRFVKKGGAE